MSYRFRVLSVAAVALLVAGWGAYSGIPWLVATAPAAASEAAWICPMHGEVRSHTPGRCELCGMPLERAAGAASVAHVDGTAADAHADHVAAPAVAVGMSDLFLDARRQRLIGVRTMTVGRGAASPTVRTVGVVRADETRQVDLNVKSDGWVRELLVDYNGRFVKRGEPMLRLHSPELLSMQNDYLLALKARGQSADSSLDAAREYAVRLAEAARQRLRLRDLSDEQIAELEQRGVADSVVTFTSPATGYVIEKQVLNGMHVTSGQTLYRIADLSQVWVETDVYEQEIGLIRVGTRATVTLDAYPGERWQGRVSYVNPIVQEQSRTAKARIVLANRGERLMPGMFAHVEWQAPAAAGIVIPANALIASGSAHMVFVAQGDGYFIPREVQIGRRLDDAVEILGGLAEGEQIADAATFFLDSESQLRSGLESYAASPVAATAARTQDATIELTTDPAPPRAGLTTFEARVIGRDGQPLNDAEVSVTLFMPPMPSMNMPAMRSQAVLPRARDGAYRGRVDVLMSGRWDVTVTAMRAGQTVASHQTSIVAR
jgi:Cu(I)/Ag(I) efflux system membrane fusion protein